MVAPATTAFAATTSGQYDKDTGEVTPVKNGTEAGSLNLSSTVAIAMDSADGSTVGEATGQSNVNVNVLSGVLSLSAVPDFGFGSGAAGTTVNLLDNNADGIGEDGNAEGNLSVIDSRDTQSGFTVAAQLGDFTTGDPAVKASGFQLQLNPVAMSNSASNSNLNNFNTLQGVTNDSGQSTTVMNALSGAYKKGTVTAQFKDAADAALYIPNAAGSATGTSTAKAYKGTVTWTLTTKPQADGTTNTQTTITPETATTPAPEPDK